MTLTFTEPVFYGLFMVVSGGQCGADQGGLQAAKEMGITTTGLAPKGWKTCRGPRPQLARFNLLEDTVDGYTHRTKINVETADATVIIASNPSSSGSRVTAQHSKKVGKPCLVIQVSSDMLLHEMDEEGLRIAQWILEKRINILNVAGNRDHFGAHPLHHSAAHRILTSAFQDLHRNDHLVQE